MRCKADDVVEVLAHTGQHHDHNLSEVFFEELDVPQPATTSALAAVLTAR